MFKQSLPILVLQGNRSNPAQRLNLSCLFNPINTHTRTHALRPTHTPPHNTHTQLSKLLQTTRALSKFQSLEKRVFNLLSLQPATSATHSYTHTHSHTHTHTLSRQIKAHWEIMHRNSHNLKLQVSAPNLRTCRGQRESQCVWETKPCPPLPVAGNHLHTWTPAWEEKFVREKLRTEEIFQQTIKTKKDTQLMIKPLETQLVEKLTFLFKWI